MADAQFLPQELAFTLSFSEQLASENAETASLLKTLPIERRHLFVLVVLARIERDWLRSGRLSRFSYPIPGTVEDAMIRAVIEREMRAKPDQAEVIKSLDAVSRAQLAWGLVDGSADYTLVSTTGQSLNLRVGDA